MSNPSSKPLKSLLLFGVLLFLLGLLQGFLIPVHQIPRLGLSAHLAAVQSGMALMIFGFAVPFAGLSKRMITLANSSLASGMYLVWMAITLAAATGASKSLPIAGGTPINESAEIDLLVTAMLGVGSLLAAVGTVITLVGLGNTTLRSDRLKIAT